jgi:hypothetical protein
MIEQETIFMRDLTDDELHWVSGGTAGQSSLRQKIVQTALHCLGPFGMLAALAQAGLN